MRNKILIITSLFYPDTVGGGEKVLYYQAQELLKHGYEVTVLTRKNRPDLKDEEIVKGLKVIRYQFPASHYLGKSLADILFLGSWVKKMLKAQEFDLVISHYSFSSYGFYRAKIKLPGIYIFHASYYLEVMLEGIERKTGWQFLDQIIKIVFAQVIKHIERKSLQCFDRIVIESDFSKKLLKNTYKVSDDKISLIHCGIDLAAFRPAADKIAVREKLKLPKDKFLMFTVRRLVPRMGLENLLEAAVKLKEFSPDFLLIIGGKGILHPKLKQLAEVQGLENNLLLTGFIPDKDLPLYYQAADVFVLPTLAYEGFGLVTLEALASGTPALGTPAGATPEILSRLNKDYIFKSSQPDDLAEGIIRFWKAFKPADLALAQRLRSFVEQNYSWQKSGDLLVKEIERLVA